MKRKKLIYFIIILIVVLFCFLGISKRFWNQKKALEESSSQKKLDSFPEDRKLTSNMEVIATYFAKYFSIHDMKNIQNQDLLLFAYYQIGYQEEITAEEVENVIQQYFGKEMTIIHEDIECPTTDPEPMFLWDGVSYKPNPNHGGHGGPGYSGAFVHYVSGTKEEDTITVNYKIAYSNACMDTCVYYEYYGAYKDKKNVLISSKEKEPLVFTDEIYEKVKDKIPLTEVVYQKTTDGTYNIKSITVKE